MRTIHRNFLLALMLALVGAGMVPLSQRASASGQAQTTAAPARPAAAQPAARVTTPKEEWGQNIGDDYFLANYQQLIKYWRKLEKESPRIKIEEIGQSAMKRPHLMAIITAPENHKNIAKYKDISRRLSLAEGLTDAQARALARDGKAVVWIDGGLHASESLGAQQLMELVYQMVSRTDEETMRFLNDVILLAVCANPDGLDLVADAYMKHTGTTGGHPGLYNYYAGHDDNRDSYMNALPETTNMSRIMYREWFPQIMYNHHQSGPGGAVMFAPPFRDPHNYNFHPMIPAGIELVASAMHTRFIAEGKPGVVSRRGASYSTWWNGGLRTTAYFHNQIGILTETIGNPTPAQIGFTTRFLVPDSNGWYPITPQPWHFRQSIDYSITANRAILDLASRYRETLLYRIYKMGADNIQWGNEDHWTDTPHKLERIQASMPGGGRAGGGAPEAGGGGRGGGGGGRGGGGANPALWTELRKPEHRDPRGFILPAGHDDFGTSIRFVNTLMKSGVTIHRATASFTVAGKQYPAGSLVVKTGQAFRPHVMDMFEPQDHPDDIPYSGAPPTAPYDVAGWTLAYQMGVVFDRVLDGFDGPFEKLTDFAKPPAGSIRGAQTPAGYYFSHKSNDSFIAINRLLAANEEVTWLWNGPMGYGTFYVTGKPTTRPLLQKIATDLGVSFEGAPAAPTGPSAKLRKLRIGLFDTYGGGMPSGWTRLLLENFEFPFEVVYPPMLDAGNLREKYDVIVFNDAGLNAGGGGGRGGGRGAGGDAPPGADAPPAAGGAPPVAGGRGGRGGGRGAGEKDPNDKRAPFVDYPDEFTKRRGNVTPATLEKIKEFVQAGGTVLAIGGASEGAIGLFKLPLSNHLVTPTGGAVERTQYYIPGSVMRVAVDSKNPLAHGYGAETDIFFDNSPVWRINPSAGSGEVRSVAWFASPTPLRSGWAWGQKYLDKGIQIAETNVGKGRVLMFGNDLLFRTQPHGNYKFFFNGLYLSVADGMKAGLGTN
jgi:zinc carboxypeptidase